MTNKIHGIPEDWNAFHIREWLGQRREPMDNVMPSVATIQPGKVFICDLCIEQIRSYDSHQAHGLELYSRVMLVGMPTTCYFCRTTMISMIYVSLVALPYHEDCSMCGLPVRIKHLRPEHCTVTIGQAVMSLFRWGTIAAEAKKR